MESFYPLTEEKALPKMIEDQIIQALPYGPGFLFVDQIIRVDEHSIEGTFEFKADSPWYRDHFPASPITPGVLLIECMAQIGLVSLGLFLMEQEEPGILEKLKGNGGMPFLFSQSEVLFAAAVFPGSQIFVSAIRQYWRLGKLKCSVEMKDKEGNLIASGSLSGIRNRPKSN
jgi:3-hydroxyacyl-[acyl-carrier-protein] dehydratase